MANAREIQARMKSIKDTMKITNAMYMISSSKLQKARRDLKNTEPYFYTIQDCPRPGKPLPANRAASPPDPSGRASG